MKHQGKTTGEISHVSNAEVPASAPEGKKKLKTWKWIWIKSTKQVSRNIVEPFWVYLFLYTNIATISSTSEFLKWYLKEKLKTCSFKKLLGLKMKWICSYTEYQSQSETLISWALTDRTEKGPLPVTFSVSQKTGFGAAALTRADFRVYSTFKRKWRHSPSTGGKAGLSGCSSTSIFLPPIKLLVTEFMDLGLLPEWPELAWHRSFSSS